ncbi:Beta-lactamase class C [Cupriavidus necator]|nr:serine hydrolase domain-containing protein [Cupriavidus necator]WKA44591.1 serine hydrolase domain-containing protein [Cupriavidus necator]
MLNGFDALVEESMADWKIPGLALAVIRDGEPVLMLGYGVRDSAGSAPVTTATQFMLCSITKSFTAAGLGLLVDERRLDWATPVRDLIPGFRLHDAVTTERITVRDLLCHHSGMPRHDWLHTPGDLDTGELLARLRHLAPSRDLRERWQYQNLGYVIAGHVAERLSGQRWEDFTEERLLRPLGFSRFGFCAEALAAAPDHAHPHTMVASECLRANWSSIVKPAGGLATSVEDLAKWMRCLLDEGKVGGRALLSPAIVRDMMTPGVHIGMSEFPEVGDQHYGLGLTVEQYRGERTVSHSGSWLGWAALMTLMPSRRIGIAVLTNRAPSAVTALLTYAALDQLRGHAPIDWLGRMRARRQEMLAQLRVDKSGAGAACPASSPIVITMCSPPPKNPPKSILTTWPSPSSTTGKAPSTALRHRWNRWSTILSSTAWQAATRPRRGPTDAQVAAQPALAIERERPDAGDRCGARRAGVALTAPADGQATAADGTACPA